MASTVMVELDLRDAIAVVTGATRGIGRHVAWALGRLGARLVIVGRTGEDGYTSNGPIMDIPWRRWEAAFRVQVVAPLQLCQGFVPGMLDRGAGRVVNVSTEGSQLMMANLALYSVSKLAMERWNDYMHLEVGGRGVSFNALRVDRVVRTEGWQHVVDTQGIDIAAGGADPRSFMTSEEAAAHVAWMVSQPSSWSGHTVGFDDITVLGGPPTPPHS